MNLFLGVLHVALDVEPALQLRDFTCPWLSSIAQHSSKALEGGVPKVFPDQPKRARNSSSGTC